MYLGQQSIEKQTKSMMLKLGEQLGLGMGEDLLHSLGHRLYPKIFQLYKKHVAGINMSGFPVGATSLANTNSVISVPAQNEDIFKHMEDYWHDYNYDLQELTWQNSMEMPLEEDDLKDLNLIRIPYLKHLFEYIGLSGMDIRTITNEYILHPPMRRALDDDALLTEFCDSYCALPINVAMRNRITHKFYDRRPYFSLSMKTAIDSLQHPYERIARRLMVEFGFIMMVAIAHRYMEIIPHNTLGRYPKKLGDRVTTDVYKSQLNHVLFSLFVEIPYHLEQLCINSRRIDELWRLGCNLGYW